MLAGRLQAPEMLVSGAFRCQKPTFPKLAASSTIALPFSAIFGRASGQIYEKKPKNSQNLLFWGLRKGGSDQKMSEQSTRHWLRKSKHPTDNSKHPKDKSKHQKPSPSTRKTSPSTQLTIPSTQLTNPGTRPQKSNRNMRKSAFCQHC